MNVLGAALGQRRVRGVRQGPSALLPCPPALPFAHPLISSSFHFPPPSPLLPSHSHTPIKPLRVYLEERSRRLPAPTFAEWVGERRELTYLLSTLELA